MILDRKTTKQVMKTVGTYSAIKTAMQLYYAYRIPVVSAFLLRQLFFYYVIMGGVLTGVVLVELLCRIYTWYLWNVKHR